jgi:hypothetical protein
MRKTEILLILWGDFKFRVVFPERLDNFLVSAVAVEIRVAFPALGLELFFEFLLPGYSLVEELVRSGRIDFFQGGKVVINSQGTQQKPLIRNKKKRSELGAKIFSSQPLSIVSSNSLILLRFLFNLLSFCLDCQDEHEEFQQL